MVPLIEGASGSWEVVIGRAFDEETIFRVASVIEAAAAFKARPPFVAGEA